MALYDKDTARTVTLALNLVSTFHAFDQFPLINSIKKKKNKCLEDKEIATSATK